VSTTRRFELSGWRLFFTGWALLPAVFAVSSWIVAIESLVSPDPYEGALASVLFAAVPALALSVITAAVYRVSLRRARVLLNNGAIVAATILGNISHRSFGHGRYGPGQLTYEYFFDSRRYTKTFNYILTNAVAWKVSQSVRRRLSKGPIPRDDRAWMKSLKNGDSVEVIVDRRRPNRSQVLRAWARSYDVVHD